MAKDIEGSEFIFLKGNDALAATINTSASQLHQQLSHFDVSRLTVAAEFKDYFINHHLGRRLFFSLQNSAHIIYQSVKKSGKPINEICFIDYGAGLGTLFMLAGRMGFRKTVYNDYLPDWQQTAQLVCEALEIKIDDYVTGDIDEVTQHAAANSIQYDIIASRNVIEHIYSLPHFYSSVFKHNAKAITYSTTTANYHNPVMRWYHVYIHNKGEKAYFRQQRKDEIKKRQPSMTEDQLNRLAELTRGKGQQDFIDAINDFTAGKQIAPDKTLHSNTCDCITGVWSEHLLKKMNMLQS
ncbi:MAG: hypothetical protein IPP72_14180 [Chitinophagaceae bacterium]|nr:hypothetical protein [Chitinophagaceae bacterium]